MRQHVAEFPTGSATLREGAYRETMSRHGLQQHIRVVQADLSEHSGFEAMNSLIGSGRTPTAVFAANDILAVGALSAADDHGLGVPSRLSLDGYDSTYLAGIRHLSLTSVDPVSRDVGVRAAQLLVERMADPSLPQRAEVLRPRLVIRNSTAPAFKG
ncbi:substrate-binding domain-containing protein [Arthrobacter sp. 24S4-2]|uniref:substrate-binding domain-containing protein n=1 Tax=Arthrobacter sp. 24S4-2 TaxID=2575374 RepID=UPI001586BA7E|nr:substrate-binding domain-containing protein [Arthrobacter sp. 24S4-2]